MAIKNDETLHNLDVVSICVYLYVNTHPSILPFYLTVTHPLVWNSSCYHPPQTTWGGTDWNGDELDN